MSDGQLAFDRLKNNPDHKLLTQVIKWAMRDLANPLTSLKLAQYNHDTINQAKILTAQAPIIINLTNAVAI